MSDPRVVIALVIALAGAGACARDAGCGAVADDYLERCCADDAGVECPSRRAVKGDCSDVLKYCNDPSAKCELAEDGNGDPICDRNTTYIKCWPCEGPAAPSTD